jgi:hypothetical protein
MPLRYKPERLSKRPERLAFLDVQYGGAYMLNKPKSEKRLLNKSFRGYDI